MTEPLTMTNDEAQEWLLAQHNAAPGPPDAARFGAAIRAVRAKAIADAKAWFGFEAEARSEGPGLDGLRTALDALEVFVLFPTQTEFVKLADLRAALADQTHYEVKVSSND